LWTEEKGTTNSLIHRAWGGGEGVKLGKTGCLNKGAWGEDDNSHGVKVRQTEISTALGEKKKGVIQPGDPINHRKRGEGRGALAQAYKDWGS